VSGWVLHRSGLREDHERSEPPLDRSQCFRAWVRLRRRQLRPRWHVACSCSRATRGTSLAQGYSSRMGPSSFLKSTVTPTRWWMADQW